MGSSSPVVRRNSIKIKFIVPLTQQPFVRCFLSKIFLHPRPRHIKSRGSFRENQTNQAVLAKRIASAAASVYAGSRPLPSELNPILRPLVSAVKKEPDMQRRGRR